jgi:tetratricopeptide (TPR) repeat protein
MQPHQTAYAAAMDSVAQRFPHDADIQVLAAEAAMNLNPWRLWSLEGKAAPGTAAIVARLEKTLHDSPNHPGAHHYYIHAVEASPTPGRAEASADKLASLMPGAGHVVHMPAHIYQRVGRYADASKANRQAVEVDQRYLGEIEPWGYYPFYLSHNWGFLAYSASMEGRKEESLQAADRSVASFPKPLLCGMPGMDYFSALPYFVAIRFGDWNRLLRAPRPEAKYPVLVGLWLHGRGMALASTGRLEEARTIRQELQKLRREIPADLVADLSSARALLEVADRVVEARILERSGQAEALAVWKQAVALSDKLPYSEPADWFYPVRHLQGRALLEARMPVEAEAVYREDLRRHPRNGWALYGLLMAQRAQGLTAAANETEGAFREAWRRADISLQASAY